MRPSYVAGVSSGALVAIGLSAVLEYPLVLFFYAFLILVRAQDQSIANGFTTSELHDVLFSITNDDIFTFKLTDAVSNLQNGYLLDNSPFRYTILFIVRCIY